MTGPESTTGDDGVAMASSDAADAAIKEASVRYLAALLGQTLHLYTGDGRMFAGEFKCTDKDRNIILAKTFEYRLPSASAVQTAATSQMAASSAAPLRVDMTSRFMGLVVVPGQHITRIEVEER